jgi:hypothetical protein
MAALMILSLLPTAAIVVGVFRGVRDRCLRFAASCLVVYLLVLADLFLLVPVYSTAKATYLLGLTPAIAVVFAVGLGSLDRTRPARAVVFAVVAAWSAAAYSSFFAVG